MKVKHTFFGWCFLISTAALFSIMSYVAVNTTITTQEKVSIIAVCLVGHIGHHIFYKKRLKEWRLKQKEINDRLEETYGMEFQKPKGRWDYLKGDEK
ncbi:hypothetical protein KY343_03655 [Candidatus Woesearchaeota archaeon]|nr:hypothetical protein [Candidatus Woesearchaeota archaeon]